MNATASLLMNPQVSGMSKINTTEQPTFIPAIAIKVEQREKNKQDLPRMKNLFLANCLKLRKGELGFTERTENKMA